MAVHCLGSINADHIYAVPHLPAPGETLAAETFHVELGGKGANQSVAATRAGARVFHIGAVGQDGHWAIDRLSELGVGTAGIVVSDTPTGHAIINVAGDGENAIVLFPGANRTLNPAGCISALDAAAPGDLLLIQNETNAQAEMAAAAAARGLRVAYSAAPFDVESVRAVLPHVTLLLLNAVEAAQLVEALGQPLGALPVSDVVVTRGGDGAEWLSVARGETVRVPAHQVAVADTTGAGDTFAGYLAAGLDAGLDYPAAMTRAAAAAALKVTRSGTAGSIPTAVDVDAFLG